MTFNLKDEDEMSAVTIDYQWLERQLYEPMWNRMQQRAIAVADGSLAEMIWTCEHEAVYTTGRRGIDNRLGSELPAPMVATDRGGEMTFHGPGQIMLYPVIHLRQRGLGVREYVHLLEQSCIDLLAGLGVHADRRSGFPGIWLEEGKIAALGVRVTRGVAYHGMALNVDVDARWFAAIDPCGLGFPAISLASRTTPPPLQKLADCWHRYFAQLLL
jgi:lipoyl(octanoyl) transferase